MDGRRRRLQPANQDGLSNSPGHSCAARPSSFADPAGVRMEQAESDYVPGLVEQFLQAPLPSPNRNLTSENPPFVKI